MEELKKRLKGGAWISLAGFIVSSITIVMERVDVLDITPLQQTIVLIIGTALVSQLTKYLNKK